MNNRMLRELGWVVAKDKEKKRDSPRNSDLRLQSQDELLKKRKELMHSRKFAPSFIGQIFRSDTDIWVDRCSPIVKEKEIQLARR